MNNTAEIRYLELEHAPGELQVPVALNEQHNHKTPVSLGAIALYFAQESEKIEAGMDPSQVSAFRASKLYLENTTLDALDTMFLSDSARDAYEVSPVGQLRSQAQAHNDNKWAEHYKNTQNLMRMEDDRERFFKDKKKKSKTGQEQPAMLEEAA
jgi:hypothetical protein